MSTIKIIECPRDAMQGITRFIPTEVKVEYLKLLLKVGFDTLDFGSFVSPKAIPQMRDTHEVIQEISGFKSNSKLLAIIANERGAAEASQYQAIDFLGYPFSVSETFQLRNTNTDISGSIQRIRSIWDVCRENGKDLVIYLSMAFGNPYGDPWNAEIIHKYIDLLSGYGIKNFALSDTIGVAHPSSISYIFDSIIPLWKGLEIGAHFHTTPETWFEKIETAYLAGCKRFDGAIKGFGGCPLAKDSLTGNMPTEHLISYFQNLNQNLNLDLQAFENAYEFSKKVFL